MTKRMCGNCRWWDAGPTGSGSCHVKSPVAGSDDVFPVTHRTDRCGEWADASVTPEQEKMRELTRQFAVAFAAKIGRYTPAAIWEIAQNMAAAEPQIQRENEQ
jgi:hypothetical protein